MLLLVTFGCGDDLSQEMKQPVRVDFQKVVKNSVAELSETKRTIAKVAVAAMISPMTTYVFYKDLLNFVGERMNWEVQFVQKKTYAEVNEMLKQKDLDLAFVCSGPYVTGNSEFGLEIIAVPVSHGQKVYHSYFIVNNRSWVLCH